MKELMLLSVATKLLYSATVLHFLLVSAHIQYNGVVSATRRRPNIVIFLVDDLGIGDIGCFGNTTIKTPNIDQIAEDGVKFEHNLSPEVLCTPSRAAFLTGRYAIRSGVVAEDGDTRVFVDAAVKGGLPPEEMTFAKVLQQSGYKTALIGKWHLGLSCNTSHDFCHHPNNHGFHHFYGLPLSNFRECGDDWGVGFNNVDKNIGIIITSIAAVISFLYIRKCSFKIYILAILCLALALNFYVSAVIRVIMYKWFSCMLMRNAEVVEQPFLLKGLTQRFVSEAINFMEENQNEPFLLYMSFAKVHTALRTSEHFVNHSRHGRYGDNVEEMDWAVGKILAKLNDLKVRDDTFVLFTSDHGPAIDEISRNGEVRGGFQGIFKSGKGSNFEGGIRVPTLARWPGRIPSGSKISIPTSSLDFFPTILRIADVSMANSIPLDGKDISSIMTGDENQLQPQRFIFHYCDKSLQAITYADYQRSKIWKIHFAASKMLVDGSCYGSNLQYYNPPLIFELLSDPGEQNSIKASANVVQNVLQEVNMAVEKHNASIKPVQSQISLQQFYPWLQICCNPPICYCKEQYPHKLVSIP